MGAANGNGSEHVRVAIIGAGFAGLGLAIRLRQEGIDDIAVLEKADEVGGTWRENTYPGVACDVPSRLYSLSFAPEPGLVADVRSGSRDPGLPRRALAQLRRPAADPLRPRGDRRRLGRGRAPLADPDEPRRAQRPGPRLGARAAARAGAARRARASSASRAPRSTRPRWDHDHDLSGERVAVIGTGASAIQFVPEIQPRVATPDRSSSAPPHGSLPRVDHAIAAEDPRALPRRSRSCRARCAAGSTARARSPSLGFMHPRLLRAAAARGAARTSRARSRPGAAREARARTTRWAASASCRRTTGTQRCSSRTSSWSRAACARSASARSSRPTAASTRSTRSSSAPASASSRCRSAATCAAAAGRCSPSAGTARRTPISARPSRASRTCS